METPSTWGRAAWTELARLGLDPRARGANAARRRPRGPRVLALMPVGAVEAHGPHLPLATDAIIAAAAAKAALPHLRRMGFHPLLLPLLAYAPAPFAAGFAGTISVRPATMTALLADVAASLEAQGAAALVVVNAHLDPAHLAAVARVAEGGAGGAARVAARGGGRAPMPVIHPDLTERRWASRLTAEFRSGACHAGRYETSVVMAAAPGLVREEARLSLPENPASLSDAIRAGAATFEEAGAPEAYCGDPAAAAREEGERTIAALAGIVADAVAERLGRQPRGAGSAAGTAAARGAGSAAGTAAASGAGSAAG